MSREQGKAENEAAFRAINEHIAALGERFDTDPLELVCECSDAECTQRIAMSRSAYEQVRAAPTTFAIVPGHETAGIERVVERSAGFSIVQKGGEAAEIAAARDPRA